MKSSWRWFRTLLLIALFLQMGALAAQEDTGAIKAAGSGIVAPLFEALKTASAVEAAVETTVSGTTSGIEQFCQAQIDLALANRPISANEDANCSANGIQYTELLLANNILAFVAKLDAPYNQCLTSANLNTIFAPSAENQTTDWTQVNPENTTLPLTAFVPNASLPAFNVLDTLISGDGLRADAAAFATDEEIISAVSSDTGAVGVVNLTSAIAASDRVKILELNTNEAVGCAVPSSENVEARSYSAADQFFVYVNQASLEKPGLRDLLLFLSGNSAAAVVEEQGFTAPTANAYSANLQGVEGTGAARPFSGGETGYQITPGISGEVTIAGSVVGREYITTATTNFTGIYPGVTFDTKTEGQPEGLRRLCNGEIDVAIIEAELTAEQQQNCDANNITTFSIDLGKQAVVLVANGASEYLTCLTPEQIGTTWKAADEPVSNWTQVDASFADQAITLFSPAAGNTFSDLLMGKTAGGNTPSRSDAAEINADPLYRAAATANVEGALTYMSWVEYQSVLANNQANITLVGVKNGENCVTPSEATIADGTYLLARSGRLLFNRASFTDPAVQAFAWYIASDENYSLFSQSGFLGVSFGSLPLLRDALEQAFTDASTAVIAAPETTAEATGEAPVEATAEATTEATVEPTAEATTEATAEVTAEATVEATADATAEATAAS